MVNSARTAALSPTLILLLLASVKEKGDAVVAASHSMYIWTDAFNASASQCGGVYPPNKDGDNANCFRHSWETPEARSHLWASCAVPGREVTRIFLSDVNRRIKHGENGGLNSANECDADLMTTLAEAHSHGIEVYGLFAASDMEFSEQGMVSGLHDFNAQCGTADAYFDGASVNNEYFTKVKSCDSGNNELAQLNFLDDLKTTRDNAAPLPLHFSVSWNWDCCSCSSAGYVRRELTWNGSTKSALEHMIDVADSVDVQVAWNTGPTMTARSQRPYTYWESTKMGTTSTAAFYVLAYTNPNSDCRLSFAPHVKGASTDLDSCSTGDRTEEGMFAAFDTVRLTHQGADGGIHYMSGVYSSGMPGWPKHDAAVTAAPATATPTQAPVTAAPITAAPTRAPATAIPTKSPVSSVPTPTPACGTISDKNTCTGTTGCEWTSKQGGACNAAEGGGGGGTTCGSRNDPCLTNEDCCKSCNGDGFCR